MKNFRHKLYFTKELLLSLLVFSLLLFGFAAHFLQIIELRAGAVLDDPILKLFSPRDFTWLAFLLIYGGIVIGFWTLAKSSQSLSIALQAYSVMLCLRILSIYLLPLDPPPHMLALHDPIIEILGNTQGKILTRDLFFSGHTSTMFLLYLTAMGPKLKIFFLAGTFLLALCLIGQHVHYTIDVLAAPFFAFGALHTVKKIKLLFS